MNSITRIFIAATLSALAGYAQAAETVKPLQGVSFHAGTKHAVAYFLNHNAACKLVLTIADDANYAPMRFEAVIPDGSSRHYGFAQGKRLEFGCRDEAQSMTVNTLETLAAQD